MVTALQIQIERLERAGTSTIPAGTGKWPVATLKRLCSVYQSTSVRPSVGLVLVCIGAVGAAQAENWQITTKLGVSETLTNNAHAGYDNSSGDLISVVTPGISIDGKGARGSLRLDYGFSGIFNARDSSANRHQNTLNAVGKVEAIENWLFVDGLGTISQQYLNPVGAVSPGSANFNTNQTETSHYSLSPYVKGKLFSSVDYLLRYRLSTTSSKSNAVADLQSNEWITKLNGTTPLSAVTWSFDADSIYNDYSFGKDYESTNYSLTLGYRLNPEWRFSVNAGQESNNYLSESQQTRNNYGYGFVWTPAPLTELSAFKNKRFFGDGYEVSFKHRMKRAQIYYRASKDVSYLPSTVNNNLGITSYDFYYLQLAATNPDLSPQAVRSEVLKLLQQYNIPLNGSVIASSLTNGPNLNKLQELSLAILGVRNTVTLTITDSDRQPFVPNLDQLMSNRVRQRGIGIVWANQLTGTTSLSISLNHQQARSYGNSQQETTTDGAFLFLSTNISPKTQGNIGFRRVFSDGTVHYSESALTGGISHSF